MPGRTRARADRPSTGSGRAYELFDRDGRRQPVDDSARRRIAPDGLDVLPDAPRSDRSRCPTCSASA